MKEFISKKAYFKDITGLGFLGWDEAQLNNVQQLLQIRYRRKPKLKGNIQCQNQAQIETIELSDLIRRSLVCSASYLEANRHILLSVDPLENVIVADTTPHLVFGFWLKGQNFDHKRQLKAFIQIVRIQNVEKVMVENISLYDQPKLAGPTVTAELTDWDKIWRIK